MKKGIPSFTTIYGNAQPVDDLILGKIRPNPTKSELKLKSIFPKSIPHVRTDFSGPCFSIAPVVGPSSHRKCHDINCSRAGSCLVVGGGEATTATQSTSNFYRSHCDQNTFCRKKKFAFWRQTWQIKPGYDGLNLVKPLPPAVKSRIGGSR